MTTSTNTARVSAYRKSKSTVSTTTGFGLKLGCPLRDQWVDAGASRVRLKLEGLEDELRIDLLRGFWKGCPEFMHHSIHDWIKNQGLAIPWPKGKPHHFEIERQSGTKFIVRRVVNN